MPLDYNTQIRKFVDRYDRAVASLQNQINELKEKIEILEAAVSELIQDTESDI